MISTCCKAPIKTISGDEGTSYWECTQCQQACNPVTSEEPKQTTRNRVFKKSELFGISEQPQKAHEHIVDHSRPLLDEKLDVKSDPSLNTWEEGVDLFELGDITKEQLKDAISSQISLAIQAKEKEDVEVMELLINHAVQKEREDNKIRIEQLIIRKHRSDILNSAYNEGVEDALNIISNKGGEDE